MRTSYVPPAIPALVAMLLLQPVGGHAHDTTVPISTAKFILKAKKDKRRFVFRVKNEDRLRIQAHDPMVENSFLLVRGTGVNAGGTGLIALDRQRWTRIEKKGAIKGYKYKDAAGARGGVTRILFKNGSLAIKAKGAEWPWYPMGGHESIVVHFQIAEELYCAEIDGSATKRNQEGFLKAGNTAGPGACRSQVCGNGQHELGEECDDGNLIETDGCTTRCTVGVCEAPAFASTFDAIQSQIFDNPVYGCTNGVCHAGEAPAGGLDLTAGNAYGATRDTPSPSHRVPPTPATDIRQAGCPSEGRC